MSEGLSQSQASELLKKYGYNELKTKKVNPFLKFLSYFWGPIPWMIEIAAVLSFIVHETAELIIILCLLLLNAVIGFWQEKQASDAVEVLKEQLTLQATVKRDGAWKQIPAKELVPGDLVKLKIGEIVPADLKITSGDYLSVDQAVLTGESLPVDKKVDDLCYSGSTIKQGEAEGVVTETIPILEKQQSSSLKLTRSPTFKKQCCILEITLFA